MTKKKRNALLIAALERVVYGKDIKNFWYLFVAKMGDWAKRINSINDRAESLIRKDAIAATNMSIRLIRKVFDDFHKDMKDYYDTYKEAEKMYDPIDISYIVAKGNLREDMEEKFKEVREGVERFERIGMRQYLGPKEIKILDFIKDLTVEKILEYFNSSDMLGL